MVSQERSLPIFPLNTVLFPTVSIPIHIFEDRYKLMLEDCLSADSKFGVVLIKEGSEVGPPPVPYCTGTMAHIVRVKRVEGERRVFISIAGERRFHIRTIMQYSPYIVAEVELLDDVQGRITTGQIANIREAVTQHTRLSLGLVGGWIREVKVSSDPETLSYFTADTLQIGLKEKQALLEESSVSKRLETELSLLKQGSDILRVQVIHELKNRVSRQ